MISFGFRVIRRARTMVVAASCVLALILVRPALAETADCTGPGPDEITCLACNIYYEARDQSEAGQLAVAMVTLNRLRSPNYPKSICAVVWETRRSARTGATVAQFSWTLERRNPPTEASAWRTAVQLAQQAVQSLDQPEPGADPSLGAMFFHAWYVSPDWSSDGSMDMVTRIGDHLFYRGRGAADAVARGAWEGFRPSRALPLVRHNTPMTASAQVADLPGDGAPWVKQGAKLIRISSGSSPNTARISSYENGRVRVVMVGRERP
ncbi:cell wall hydrolase [Azospirillum sp. sgz301742]